MTERSFLTPFHVVWKLNIVFKLFNLFWGWRRELCRQGWANSTNPFSIGRFDLGGVPQSGNAESSITIPDAHLLFSGHYERLGKDLIISDQAHRVVVPNHGESRPLLVSPDGALFDSALAGALTGHAEYAQAAGNLAAKVVGHVAKMTGSARIVRNGVAVDVQVGDAIYQSDVVQTGSHSTF